MSTNNVLTAAVVALVVSVLTLAFFNVSHSAPAAQSSDTLGQIAGTVVNTPTIFVAGHSDGGNFVTVSADGEIPVGQNQAAWRNTTGRTVYVNAGDVRLGYASGTATSSYAFFVGTSTSASYTDFARPSVTTLLIDGALIATSTAATGGPITRVGTTTSAGVDVSVPAGSYVVFDVQERYFCKANAACEIATSTNRGISKFFWSLKATYKP